jgi:hypothetical protein
MPINNIKRSTLILGALALAACAESSRTPTAVQTEAAVAARSSTSRLTAIGDHATWFFQAVVFSSVGSPAQAGDTVTGQLTFAIASSPSYSDDGCTAYRSVASSASFTVHLQAYSLSGGPNGQAVSITSCNDENVPRLLVNAIQSGGAAQMQIDILNPADNFDFPLVPPVLSGDPRTFIYQTLGPVGPPGGPPGGPGGTFVSARLTKLYVGLQTKDDCKNNGWAQFGFKNQGQCVRFIETGKDSR